MKEDLDIWGLLQEAAMDITKLGTFSKNAGEAIFSQGDTGKFMYFVKTGEVEVLVHGKVVRTIGSKGFFGEMALFDQDVRTASVIAKTDCVILPVSKSKLLSFIANEPKIALVLIESLNAKFLEIEKKYIAAQEQLNRVNE